MSSATLHRIFDPLCGWCCGASPLVGAAREFVPIHPHAGGVMAGAQRQGVTPQLRDFVPPDAPPTSPTVRAAPPG